MRIFIFAVVMALASSPLWPVVAIAQEAADTTVGLGGLVEAFRPLLMEMAAIIAAAIVGWLSLQAHRVFGVEIEARHREALQSALMSGVYRGLHAVEGQADRVQFDVRSAVLAEGIRYVKRSVPDAVKHFGLTDERLRDLLEAKLPGAESGDA